MAYRDLCRPCAEKLRANGKIVMYVSGGRDHKVFCDKCYRRRFGATYKITSNATREPARPKRVKSHAKANG